MAKTHDEDLVTHTFRMSARWWTFWMWALVAASASYWGLRLFVAGPPLSRQAQVATMGRGAAGGDLSRLFGAEAPLAPPADVDPPVSDSRLQLVGVISAGSARAAREGLALIAVDGKPPKAIRVGGVVVGQNVLQAVGAQTARLGPRDGAALVVLSLSPPVPAATRMLPLPGTTQSLGPTVPLPRSTPETLPPSALGTAPSPQGASPARRLAYQTEQQLFHQRQQLQFQQEQMQNQGPYPLNPQQDPGKLR